MAAKRIAQSSVNWASLGERVPEHQRAQFLAFKSKSEGYLRRVLANPEQPPAIDWAFYKSRVPIAGMVDDFQKQYTALKIPYPTENVSSQLDALESETKNEIAKFKSDSSQRIEEYKKQLAHLASLIPYDQMTMEDYREAYPEDAVDPINKPTYWPHEPEDQIGHVDKDAPVQSSH
ncbi:unnamed protein product [Brassicogethes aeneus]|uniref:ATP synthase subunit d, mitochondrial n=1 Tax=Brassicogethes aeneus TaxID=1431903 RepID=A0A9P0AV03_BRAAE|nr:unnamed protein product [Brassicogethes aeneus]